MISARPSSIAALLGLTCLVGVLPARGADRPNILWISCEDISANLGCYGDPHARTPNLDQLAAEGARFTRAFTHAPVCAVVRSGVITGVYPVSIGSHHMRSRIVPPPHIRCFTEYLRAAGYFCTNRSKTDYQFEPPMTAWDRQGNDHGDWRDRADGQPFFSVINLTICHESQIRHSEQVHARLLARLAPEQHHDPDTVASTLPPYLVDTPATRKNWAWYHDNISEMDRQAGAILKRLDEDGLADNTIVVFWSDHGQGMPRGKRWPYDSGTHIPLIVRWPGVLSAGSVRDDLVSSIDFTPTTLSLASITVPDYMHGRVFLGDGTEPEPPFLFFHRDRMDEARDMIRSVRDGRYRYLRNFRPEEPYAQGIDYMDKMPAMRDWRKAFADGTLQGGQRNWFVHPKPIEELYDTQADPHEMHNLVGDPDHSKRLAEFRDALDRWQLAVRDLGLMPEPVLMRMMRPDGRIERTATPTVTLESDHAVVQCATVGASIAISQTAANAKPESWQLYNGPVTVPSGQMLHVRACRLGFRDSRIVTFQPQDGRSTGRE